MHSLVSHFDLKRLINRQNGINPSIISYNWVILAMISVIASKTTNTFTGKANEQISLPFLYCRI